jgi:hypothetical protein
MKFRPLFSSYLCLDLIIPTLLQRNDSLVVLVVRHGSTLLSELPELSFCKPCQTMRGHNKRRAAEIALHVVFRA